MTTTLTSLKTPSPLAMIPDMFRAKLMITIIASNRLNLSIKNQKFDANVFTIISAKKQARKEVSTLLKIESLMNGIKSARVSQKMIKTVYREISTILRVSKY